MPSASPSPQFVLASASPRRARLLQQIGAPFLQHPADIDESARPGESAGDYVHRLAGEKTAAVLSRHPALPVLGSDTTVVLDDRAIGKPRDEADAVAILRALSGRWHRVLTGVSMSDGVRCEYRLSTTEVLFAPLSEERCRRYWATGEPVGKAGAYAIQGKGAAFVECISGSYSGVMGLPLAETAQLLDVFGVDYWN